MALNQGQLILQIECLSDELAELQHAIETKQEVAGILDHLSRRVNGLQQKLSAPAAEGVE